MKARKLELKEIEMTDEVYNSTTKEFEIVKQGTFSYREIVRNILMTPGPQGHTSSEEVIKSVMLYGKLKDELRKGGSVLLLDKEDYTYLIARLDQFKWGMAHPVIADFIKYLRDLKEVDVEETKSATNQEAAPAKSA